MNIKNYRTNVDSLGAAKGFSPRQEDDIDMVVLDADGGDWMTKWTKFFKSFAIDYLRSPMFFHIDPADRDALLGFTYEQEKDGELQALAGCVGKETSKHRKKKKRQTTGRMSQGGADVDERDRKDYFTPSSSLFDSHCRKVINQYGLEENVVRKERVQDIEYSTLAEFEDSDTESVVSEQSSSSDEMKVFRVSTDNGFHLARVVILAVGAANSPSIPCIDGLPPTIPHEGFCHAMQLGHFPPKHMISKIKSKTPSYLLIVGGGLTSVQLADLAIKRGVDKVWLFVRGQLKVKYFDVDLEWVGKFRNVNQAAFWSADSDEGKQHSSVTPPLAKIDIERWEMLKGARNGGSITPRYRKILDAHVTRGRISLHTHTEIESLDWDPGSRTWTRMRTSTGVSLPPIDYIVFATGVQSDIASIPYMQRMQQTHPVDVVGGLPCLNDDLMWCDDVPLFVTGRLAGLRLGPGAPNLVGARVGAERIAWNVTDILQSRCKMSGDAGEAVDVDQEENYVEFVAGRKNRFDSLVDEGDRWKLQ
jgi:hypothetical protein